MRFVEDYDRKAAVEYAHTWAYGRNPFYYDYEHLGGDCTNFVSQCLYAGGGIMNYSSPFGWYYIDANRKAPAWTGVPYLHQFLTREKQTIGPVAKPCELWELRCGDIVQLSFDGKGFQHTPIVVLVEQPVTPERVFVAAHSDDADYRPLSTYPYQRVRLLHILGTMRP